LVGSRSEKKISPSSFGLCAFRASVGGVCFVLTVSGAGGSGRVTSHPAGKTPKVSAPTDAQ